MITSCTFIIRCCSWGGWSCICPSYNPTCPSPNGQIPCSRSGHFICLRHEFPVLVDNCSNVAEAYALAERGDFVGALGHEFLGDIPFEAGVKNGLHNPRVVQLLGVVNLAAPGHAAGVVVVEETVVFANGVADIPVHDLHVKNVIKDFEPFGADSLDKFDAPCDVVSLVVMMRALAVEQLQAESDFTLFG